MAPKKDPANYMFRKLQGQVLVKPPGSLHGNGFLMDHLVNCEVYILDHTSQITIDDCTDCKIFIGPCDGSVFIRDCARLTMAVAARQLRTRDCTDLDLSLYCATNPSIETSTGVVISRWCGDYEQLAEHFAAARLNPETNTWDQVYDFNAGEEINGTTAHWSLSHEPRPTWHAPPPTDSTVSTTHAAAPASAPEPAARAADTPSVAATHPALASSPDEATTTAAASVRGQTRDDSSTAPRAAAASAVAQQWPTQRGPVQWDGGIDLDEEEEEQVDEGVGEVRPVGGTAAAPQQTVAPAPAVAAPAPAAAPAAAAAAGGGPSDVGPQLGALMAAVGVASTSGGSGGLAHNVGGGVAQGAPSTADARDAWRAAERARIAQAAAAEAAAKQAARAAGQALLERRAAARKAQVAARRTAPGRGNGGGGPGDTEHPPNPPPSAPGAPPAWSAVTALLPVESVPKPAAARSGTAAAAGRGGQHAAGKSAGEQGTGAGCLTTDTSRMRQLLASLAKVK